MRFEGPPPDLIGTEGDDDTIELELNESELQVLSQAASVQKTDPAPQESDCRVPAPKAEELPGIRAPGKRQMRFALVTGIVAAASILLTVIAYVAATRIRGPVHLVAAVVSAPPAPETIAPSPLTEVPVRFVNPFDATEVFEFPPGTSNSEARQAVADLLLQRARDRRSSGAKTSRRNRKAADSNTPSTPGGPPPHSEGVPGAHSRTE